MLRPAKLNLVLQLSNHPKSKFECLPTIRDCPHLFRAIALVLNQDVHSNAYEIILPHPVADLRRTERKYKEEHKEVEV